MPGTPSITCVCFLTGTERYIVNATQPHNLHGTNVWTNKWKLQICSPFCQALPQPSLKGGGCFQWWSQGCVYFFQEKVFQYTCSPFCLHIWNSGGPVCTQHLEIQHKQYGKYGSSPHLWLLTIAGHSVCDCLGGSGGQILSGGGSPAAAHYDTIHPEPPWLHAANTNKRTNGAATPPFQCSRGDEQVLHRSQLVIRESNFYNDGLFLHNPACRVILWPCVFSLGLFKSGTPLRSASKIQSYESMDSLPMACFK